LEVRPPTSDPSLTWYCICLTIDIDSLKTNFMGNLLYVVAVVLIIIWAIGFFGYAAGGIIHILLVIAIIAILLKVIRGAAD
jgi:hypothetical protein